jgi:hypothetical protein
MILRSDIMDGLEEIVADVGLEEIVDTDVLDELGLKQCKRCGEEKLMHKDNKHLCIECVKVENVMVSHRRRHNEGWMAVAKEAEIELWSRQPRETDREWQIWLCYRDQYPSKRPTFVDVAEQLTTTVSNVRSVGTRWEFPVRMQAWAKYVDTLTQNQRQKEILAMNEKHISMANKLNAKLERVIENIDVDEVTPSQLASLVKVATDLERKAGADALAINENIVVSRDKLLGREPIVAEADKSKQNELQEIVNILAKAGALGSIIGVKQTTTTTTNMELVTADVDSIVAGDDDDDDDCIDVECETSTEE